MQRSSTSDYEGQQLQNVALRLGKNGLDLRSNDSDMESLSDLVNARFVDSEVVERRPGHTARILQDQHTFPDAIVKVLPTWVYCQGNLINSSFPSNFNSHYPISSQNLHTFNLDDYDVSWTGDRLLIHNNTSKCSGSSTFWWNRENNQFPIKFTPPPQIYSGVACLPVTLIDSTPSVKVTGNTTNTFDTVINETYRGFVYTSGGNTFAQISDRFTNQLINLTQLNNTTTNNSEPRIIVSAGFFIAYWKDLTTGQLYTAFWNGTSWSSQVSLFSAESYDIETTSGDIYYLAYRHLGVIKARAYVGNTAQNAPFAFDTIVNTTGSTPSGPVAIATAPNTHIALAWYSTTGYWAREYNNNLTTITNYNLIQIDSNTATSDCVTVCSNGLVNILGNFNWSVGYGYLGGNTYTSVVAFGQNLSNTTITTQVGDGQKFNCVLASKCFKVGAETFIWMKSNNSPVYFLVAGVVNPIICAYADRGEAAAPNPSTGNRTLCSVTQDPLNQYKYTWARPITGASSNANHARYSEINFLPQITTAKYGKSIYISGSAVKNFDGYECSDAGFHDYPITTGGVAAAGGSLSAGNYSVRCYVVRYNSKGEKFTSPALTSATVTAAGSQKITWTIQTVQSCTSTDCTIEVYRTLAGGTTYFLEGTVANNLAAATVQFVSTMADATLALQPGDAFQPQLGGLAETLNWGPIGCTTLITYNDRIWGIGGQVPAGKAQFSKLKVEGFGAGFDAIAGSLVVDSEGGEITSIAGMNDSVVIFEADKIFVVQDEGPDNFNRGGFPAAKFAAAKGATTHFGTILTDVGIVYWNEGGPHLLNGQFVVNNISDPVRPLAITLTPTGVRLNPQKQEVVWYTNTGTALLWDYKSGSRWARWDRLYITSASNTALSTLDGLILTPDESVYQDAGGNYFFSLKTNQIKAEALMQGYAILRRYGIVGIYKGEHTLTFRLYYNGSPLWEESEEWAPELDTYLQPVTNFGSLTAAQVDALAVLDKSGNYATHRRAIRQNCQRMQIEITDNAPNNAAFIPKTLEFEIGARPGFGRTPVTTFTDK